MNEIMETASTETLLPADPMVTMIERVVMDPNADIGKLEKMLEMREKLDARAAKAAYAEAFSRASTDFPTIPLNGKGHNNKPYATLEDITRLTRPVLSQNGLALTFAIDVGESVVVTAKLMHRSGHVEETSMALPRDTSGSKNAVQSVGSTQKYGQRYTAQAILGLSLGEDDEDDGRSSGPAEKEQPKKQYSWANTVTQDLPPDATPRDKAEAVADALCAQWKRMKGERQMHNEWDRRASIVAGLEDKHHDLFERVVDAYETRINEIGERE